MNPAVASPQPSTSPVVGTSRQRTLPVLVAAGLILFLGTGFLVWRLWHAFRPFKKEKITEKFIAELPVFQAIVGGNLEVGTGEATEVFNRSDARYTGFGWVYLGTTTTEIRVPVTYRYHLALSGNWHLEQSGNTCIVTVPRLQAALPVAFDTTRLEKLSGNGWSRFDKTEQLDALERSITPRLAEYAQDEHHLDLARQKFRAVVADFVRAWLLKENQWRQDRFTSVVVIFEDEQSSGLHGAPVVTRQTPKP